MGLVSSKNFVTSNAIETILAKPGKVPQDEPLWTTKPDFGKVPSYIQKNKNKLDEERKKAREKEVLFFAQGCPTDWLTDLLAGFVFQVEEYHALQRQQELAEAGVVREISGEERSQLLKHLKLKWASVNAAYQKMTFTLDTPAKQKRKEEYERQLTEIEKDIRMLEKGEHLLVVQD